MKKLVSILLVLALALGLAACANQPAAVEPTAAPEAPEQTAEQPAEQPTEEPAEKTFVFGVAMPQLDNDGFKANRVGIEQYAKDNNITIQVTDAKGNAETQMQQIEDFITQGVDAVIFCPVDSSALSSAVEKCNEAGVPIVSFDRNITSGELVALVESNNVAHGAKAADLLLAAAEAQGLTAADLQVLELLGAQGTSAGQERHKGFSERCAELGIKIVAEIATEWNMDTAYSGVLDSFQAKPEINAVYMASDNALYQGVESALTQLGKTAKVGEEGHIIVVSTDGGPLMLEGIRNQIADASAAQSKLVMSTQAMESAHKYLLGEVEGGIVIRIEPTPVTLENVDDPSLWANAAALYK
jgi:ABC-type sugar transport system substrate-binding protein